jgi:hypothetical protein
MARKKDKNTLYMGLGLAAVGLYFLMNEKKASAASTTTPVTPGGPTPPPVYNPPPVTTTPPVATTPPKPTKLPGSEHYTDSNGFGWIITPDKSGAYYVNPPDGQWIWIGWIGYMPDGAPNPAYSPGQVGGEYRSTVRSKIDAVAAYVATTPYGLGGGMTITEGGGV